MLFWFGFGSNVIILELNSEEKFKIFDVWFVKFNVIISPVFNTIIKESDSDLYNK